MFILHNYEQGNQGNPFFFFFFVLCVCFINSYSLCKWFSYNVPNEIEKLKNYM